VASDFARPLATEEEGGETPVVQGVVLTDRGATLAEFEDHLRTSSNRDGRPYEEKTINAYVAPGKNLDAWLTAKGIDGAQRPLLSVTLCAAFGWLDLLW
jgi:hypothetical protein